jgi:hypothetical protein
MCKYGGLEFFPRFGEQPRVVRVSEGGEEIPWPFARLPVECITACLQHEPVSALPMRLGCPVDVLEQVIWNMEGC